jgi:hypothetical protein
MRTTLDIDDDVLAAAKELSRQQGLSAGAVVSMLLRRALLGTADPATPAAADAVTPPNGFRPFASRGVPVTNELVHALRDAEGI